MRKTSFEKIAETINQSSKNRTDIFIELFNKHVATSASPWNILRTIIEYDSPVGDENASPEMISLKRKSEIEYLYGNLVREIVRITTRENLSESNFYKKIYDSIFQSDLIPNDCEIYGVLLEILATKIGVLPYHQLSNLLKMSDEEYHSITQKISDSIMKAIYVLNRHLNSRTEETSQIWEIAKTLDNRKEQIVFWSCVLGVVRDDDKE